MKESIDQIIKSKVANKWWNDLVIRKISRYMEEELQYYHITVQDLKVDEIVHEDDNTRSIWIYGGNRDWSFDENGECTGSGGFINL